MLSFDFAEFGRVYVPVNIKPKESNIMTPIRFKVDTGADKTTLSKSSLIMLGYDMVWIKENAIIFNDAEKPTTASGDKINAGYVQLPLKLLNHGFHFNKPGNP